MGRCYLFLYSKLIVVTASTTKGCPLKVYVLHIGSHIFIKNMINITNMKIYKMSNLIDTEKTTSFSHFYNHLCVSRNIFYQGKDPKTMINDIIQ